MSTQHLQPWRNWMLNSLPNNKQGIYNCSSKSKRTKYYKVWRNSGAQELFVFRENHRFGANHDRGSATPWTVWDKIRFSVFANSATQLDSVLNRFYFLLALITYGFRFPCSVNDILTLNCSLCFGLESAWICRIRQPASVVRYFLFPIPKHWTGYILLSSGAEGGKQRQTPVGDFY